MWKYFFGFQIEVVRVDELTRTDHALLRLVSMRDEASDTARHDLLPVEGGGVQVRFIVDGNQKGS